MKFDFFCNFFKKKEVSEINAKCSKCGRDLVVGIILFNKSRVEPFPYMGHDEVMHLECYVEHIVEKCLKEKGENVR